MNNKLIQQLNFLTEVDKMKNIYRQTLLVDKSRRETDAEHSWHFALMALTLFEYCEIENVDIDRVIKMALVHDLVEIYAGDTFAYDEEGNKSKKTREIEAAEKLFALLPKKQADEYKLLWEEFDSMATPDSMYASAIDRLQPFLNNYHTDGHTWLENGISEDKVYQRMEPVISALPKISDFVNFVIEDSIKKGYIKSED